MYLSAVNYCNVLWYAADYGISAFKQLRFMQHFLKPIVEKHCKNLQYPLSKKEQKKVDFYYPLFNHIVNCENYLCIKGRKLSVLESKRLAIISAMATLYDDLIDEEKWTEEQYIQIINRTIPTSLQSKKVQLIFALDDELHKIWNPSTEYKSTLQHAIEWQVKSAIQLNSEITLEEVLNVSKYKCGNSSLLWASVMDEPWTNADKDFIFQSGFVGQLVNDLFDTFKDREDGIYTFVRKTKNIAAAKEIFLNECKCLHQMVLKAGDKKKSLKTIRRMSCIHAFALVALEHLQHTENKYGTPLNWQLPLRKELVTDMAFWRNKFKLLPAAVYLGKLR